MSANTEQMNHTGGNGEAVIDENDRIINSIQGMRERFIGSLMRNGQPPTDIEDRAFMIQLMNGATSTALGNKKVKAAEKTAASNQQMVKTLAEAVRIGRSHESAEHRATIAQERVVPKVPINVVPGNTDIGAIPVSTTSIANGGDGFIDKD